MDATDKAMLGIMISHISIIDFISNSSFGPSQQCCYGDDGNILTGTNGGSAYRVYPNSWSSLIGIITYIPNLLIVFIHIGHIAHDVVPHYLCCDGKYFSGCELYNEKRPNDNGSDYPARPPPGTMYPCIILYFGICLIISSYIW